MGPPVYSLASLPSLLIAPKLRIMSPPPPRLPPPSSACLSWWFLPVALNELLGHINNLKSSYSKDYVILSRCACMRACVCGGIGWGHASAACPYVSILVKWLLWPQYQEAYECDTGRRGICTCMCTHTCTPHTHTHWAIRLICATLNNLKLHLHPPCFDSHSPLLYGCMSMKQDFNYRVFLTTAFTLITIVICLSFRKLLQIVLLDYYFIFFFYSLAYIFTLFVSAQDFSKLLRVPFFTLAVLTLWSSRTRIS